METNESHEHLSVDGAGSTNRRGKVSVSGIVTLIVGLAAMSFVVLAFSNNANPYVNFKEAKLSHEDRMHVVGDVIPGTVHPNVTDHTLSFDMKDLNGTRCSVVHRGEIPNNLSELKRVVVVGHMVGDGFVSQQMQMKCPSRYDAKDKKSDVS